MEISIFVAFGVSLLVAVAASWVFTRTVLARIYSLECDVADLQDRHLRTVRKAAADKRWSGEEELDEKIANALQPTETSKKKGWTKWGLKSGSSSDGSPAA